MMWWIKPGALGLACGLGLLTLAYWAAEIPTRSDADLRAAVKYGSLQLYRDSVLEAGFRKCALSDSTVVQCEAATFYRFRAREFMK